MSKVFTVDQIDERLGGAEVVFQCEYNDLLAEVCRLVVEAEQRGAERERAAVVAWLRRGLSFDARAEAIEAGKHREEE